MSEATEPSDLVLSTPQSLSRAVYARRAEYTRPRRMRLKVGSWNVAACPGTDKDLAAWFIDGKGLDANVASPGLSQSPAVETEHPDGATHQSPGSARVVGGDQVDLYVLGLQEVVTLNPVTQYVYSDSNPTDKWRLALEAALPAGYQFVGSEQMSGLLLLMYASPALASCVANVSTKAVGTGVGGWFGNKGATAARVVLGETTRMVFVNSHLSSGNDPATVERRCWDARTILDRTRFDPAIIPGRDEQDDEDRIGSEDFAFWFGDLNFRLDGIPGDDIRRLLTLHTKGEYDVGRAKSRDLDGEEAIIVSRTSDSSDEQTDDASARTRSTEQSSDDDDESLSLPDPDDFDPDPHDDPASLQATLDSLLPHDQLLRVRKEGKLFHDGWHEGPITFLPSYKYDVGTVGLFDSSEKKRAPSWCDRIMYRTKRDKQEHERKLKEEEEARKRDEEMTSRGIDHAGDDDEVLFDYDPESDGDAAPAGKPGLDYDEYDENGEDAAADAVVADALDRVSLNLYTSHQRITSSDHKPLVAVFELEFDAVVPELKADVYAQVARELDRAENEGRPSITIVREGQESSHDLVDFGQVSFMQRQAAYFTIANTGGVPATICFVENPSAEGTDDGASDLARWLTTSLDQTVSGDDSNEGNPEDAGKDVVLEPGETVSATLGVCIDKVSQARALNKGQGKLEEVVVLRVAQGRDHFLPVRATWAPTCVGRSIDELIRVPDGGLRAFVASLPPEKVGAGPSVIPSALDVHRSAPKELFKLVDAVEMLTDRTLAEEEMLGSYKVPRDRPGWPFEDSVARPLAGLVSGVIEALDTDQPVIDAFPPEADPCQRLEAVAKALLLFLEGLTDGILDTSLWAKVEQAPIRAVGQGPAAKGPSHDTTEDDKSTVLDILMTAPNHNICFVFLTTTLAKVVGELAPLKRSEVDALSAAGPGQQGGGSGMGAIGGALSRRSMSLRRSMTGGGPSGAATTPVVEAVASLERRKAREHRVAQIFGPLICRTDTPVRDKGRRALEEKQKTVVELFLRRREGH